MLRATGSIDSASAISTLAFFCRERSERSGKATSVLSSAAVATWYSSGWNTWWLLRSIRVTCTGACLSARAACSPPNPPPRITTLGRPVVSTFMRPSSVASR
jgi:hypothetical protein